MNLTGHLMPTLQHLTVFNFKKKRGIDVWYPGLSAVSNECLSVCLYPYVLPASQQVEHFGLSLTLHASFSFTTCCLLVTSGTRTKIFSQGCCASLQLRKEKIKLRHDCHRSSSKLNLEKRIIFLLWCFHCRSRIVIKKQNKGKCCQCAAHWSVSFSAVLNVTTSIKTSTSKKKEIWWSHWTLSPNGGQI